MRVDGANGGAATTPWWQTRWCTALLVLLAAVPLLYPPTPPLLDLPSHIGRYRIQLEHDSWPTFRAYYHFHWALIGNLGFDLAAFPLTPVFGLENSIKLLVLTIPTLAVAGFLWTAHEIHGRIPPTALFALPLAYNFPLHFGFVNFSWSMALAFVLFPLWLRLGRQGKLRLRAAIFVPVSLLLWVVHTFGWGLLGVLAFAAELMRQRSLSRGWIAAVWHAGLACLPLAPPTLLMIAWRFAKTTQGSLTEGFFLWVVKVNYLITLLRDRWRWFDLGTLAVMGGLLVWAVPSRKFTLAPALVAASALLLPVYLLLPARLFGAAYADMRLLPYLCATLLLAIRPSGQASAGFVRALALAGLAFVLVRTGGTTASLALYSETFQRELQAVPHIREGSRVVALIGAPCRSQWFMRRLDHLSGLAIARRRAFTNDQWHEPGAQWVLPYYPAAGRYASDSSQIVRLRPCPGVTKWYTIDDALRDVNRDAFDYIWMIEPGPYDRALIAGLAPVWRRGDSVLLRIDHPAAKPAA